MPPVKQGCIKRVKAVGWTERTRKREVFRCRRTTIFEYMYVQIHVCSIQTLFGDRVFQKMWTHQTHLVYLKISPCVYQTFTRVFLCLKPSTGPQRWWRGRSTYALGKVGSVGTVQPREDERGSGDISSLCMKKVCKEDGEQALLWVKCSVLTDQWQNR